MRTNWGQTKPMNRSGCHQFLRRRLSIELWSRHMRSLTALSSVVWLQVHKLSPLMGRPLWVDKTIKIIGIKRLMSRELWIIQPWMVSFSGYYLLLSPMRWVWLKFRQSSSSTELTRDSKASCRDWLVSKDVLSKIVSVRDRCPRLSQLRRKVNSMGARAITKIVVKRKRTSWTWL